MSSPDDDDARLLEAMIETSRREALLRAARRNAEPGFSPDPETPSQEPMIDLFDIDELRRKLPPAEPVWDESRIDYDDGPPPPVIIPDETLAARNARIREIIRDPRGPKRRLLIASQLMIDRIGDLKELCPGLEMAIEIILRAAHLSCVTGSPLRIPPLLLQGPPGVGKTHFARHLAKTLGIPFAFTAMDMMSERGTMTGLTPTWKAAKPGKIAEALLDSDTAGILFVCDEIDKVSPIHQHEKPLAFLHTVLEPENAKAFTDEYLGFPIRADYCVWIFTSNDETVLPPSVLDRLLVLRIPEPSLSQMLKIAAHIYREANAEHGNWFESEPDEALLSALAQSNPRHAVRILDLAMGIAAQQGRRRLDPADILTASALIEAHKEARASVGFVHHLAVET